MLERGFAAPRLDPGSADDLRRRAVQARGAVLTMTTLAASGHPGGSMSSMELFLTLYSFARLRPGEPAWPGRDRVVVSHGHTSPGVYVALADAGFFDLEEAVAHFRQAGSPFEGHVERAVPGVEWSTGNLGQGLSAGAGMAFASRLTGGGWHTFVTMSDGEQMKGQVGEARRLASKYRLCDLTAVVDVNGIQISGHTADVMPVDVAAGFVADGWHVTHVDGHDVEEVYAAVAAAVADPTRPHAVLARTVIGKGVSFMEDKAEFHGRGLTPEEYVRAMAELRLDAAWLDRARERRGRPVEVRPAAHPGPVCAVGGGEPRTYAADARTDDRSAWGAALVDLAAHDPGLPVAVLDCDLATSVKTDGFQAARPDAFIECGVGEHNAAVVAGALSVSGVLTFWSDFGVFGLDEAYNQQRLNDINGASLKLVLTHCGLDVGEDGRTHQCIDYVGALRGFFGWRVIVPADPNQTDRAVRAASSMPGNVCVAMGRSKLAVLAREDGRPAFAGDYAFRYGAIDVLREGARGTVVAMGTVAGPALDAAEAVRADGAGLGFAVVSCPLDLDDAAMGAIVARPLVVTVEDHGVRTGLGASVAEWIALHPAAGRPRLVRLGVERYATSGTAHDVLASAGLDARGIEASLRAALADADGSR